jgi:hypothetical protein
MAPLRRRPVGPLPSCASCFRTTSHLRPVCTPTPARTGRFAGAHFHASAVYPLPTARTIRPDRGAAADNDQGRAHPLASPVMKLRPSVAAIPPCRHIDAEDVHMFLTIYSAELARAHHRELLDQAAHRRLVRHAHRARRSTRQRRWGRLAKLTSRSTPATSCRPALPCDPPPMPAAGTR